MRHPNISVARVSKEVPKKASDIEEEPEGKTMRSHSLSRKKKMLDMADGDEHFVSNLCVGPINDMYLAIRAFSMFPHGIGIPALIYNTKEGRK